MHLLLVKHMEIRRIQVTGGSSYVITLPKEWIKSLNIKKNDPLGILMQPDGTLLITSKMTQDQTHRIKEFDISRIPKPSYLSRRLIGAYIAGYSSIKIRSPNRMPPEIREVISKFTETTIGQEVVEETDSTIILKDLLNPIEMPFDRTIKRMHIIVKNMQEDAIKALKNKNKTLVTDIISRDNDVDRLHWLVARQHNIIMKNISMAEKMNITIGMSSTCFLISRIIERIGDHVVRISQHMAKLIDKDIDEEIITHIEQGSMLSLTLFNNSIGSFFKKNIVSSNENIEAVAELEALCEKINALALQKRGALAISVGYIVDSIRRIGEYATDISETVINYLVDEEK